MITNYKSFEFKVGLIDINDYFNSYKDKNCENFNIDYKKCKSYLDQMFKGNPAWTLSKEEDSVLYVGNDFFPDILITEFYDIYPTVYLNSKIKLAGFGTYHNPFVITNIDEF